MPDQIMQIMTAHVDQAERTHKRILFVDLDGTVRYSKRGTFINEPEDVLVYPEAIKQMRRFKKAGWRIAAITNQGGIAMGFTTLDKVMAGIHETNDLCEEMFDFIGVCPHHPDAKDPEESRCFCRKPQIGTAVAALSALTYVHNEHFPMHKALFVGDRPEDEDCAKNMSVDFMSAEDWRAGKFDPKAD